MLKVNRAVPLGRLATCPAPWPRHHLVHLAEPNIIVTATCRTPDPAWQCQVVASHRPWTRMHPILTAGQLAAGSTWLDPDQDPDTFSLLWQARVFQRWPGGPILALAHLCAQQLRPHGDLQLPAIALDGARIATRIPNTRPPGVRCILHRLETAGFLRATPHGARLSLPQEHGRSTP